MTVDGHAVHRRVPSKDRKDEGGGPNEILRRASIRGTQPRMGRTRERRKTREIISARFEDKRVFYRLRCSASKRDESKRKKWKGRVREVPTSQGTQPEGGERERRQERGSHQPRNPARGGEGRERV